MYALIFQDGMLVPVSVKCVTVRTKDVDVLFGVHLLEFFTSRTQVQTGIKYIGLFGKDAADCSSHCKTTVRVNVDFANCTLSGLSELFLGNTNRIRNLSAVLLNFLYILLWN